MRSFATLAIWSNERIRSKLDWYYKVSNNVLPAKYLICRRIAAPDDVWDMQEDELWRLHERLSAEFDQLRGMVRMGRRDLGEEVRPNFLSVKVALTKKILSHCYFCRWYCRVDRVAGKKLGACQLGEQSRVSSYFHHTGEELPIRGTLGSGTIFFTSCNMRCAFCQNSDISHDKDNGTVFTPRMLAWAAWLLRMEGCHNVNFVGGEPTIHLHNIVEAISLLRNFNEFMSNALIAKADYLPYPMNPRYSDYRGEFNVPILWNSNMFMSREALLILRELVDIWLPDFKFGNNRCALWLSRTPWYLETVSTNHRTIYEWGEDIIIRHLVMPGHMECCTKPVLRWISENMPDTPVNVMDQYHPDAYCNPNDPRYDSRYGDMARYPTRDEIYAAYKYAKELGLNFDDITFEKSLRRVTL
ncbi:MAG: radical SAM protein [Aigarchaeota archaeon]|nr:radical SAM protein [Aigarchaeota archaeon]MDW8092843.1 radical SAM protein [Nitrososphaerota archaeon]